jgi:simple sugar transport system ATP-binding protein
MSDPSSDQPVNRPDVAIAAHNLARRFGHVQALSDASVEVHSGEVVALFGDNGAGKSTLLKMLLGIVRPDSGSIVIGDEPVELHSVRDAQAPDLSVMDNMFLGHELLQPGLRRLFGSLQRKEMAERADQALRDLNIKLPSLTIPISDLSGGQKQAVAVAKAVMWSSTAVLMDEPTAALGARQSETVCELFRSVAARGLGVLVVSHDLPRVLKVADRVVILWRGQTALDAPAADLTVPDVVATMVGFRKEEAA